MLIRTNIIHTTLLDKNTEIMSSENTFLFTSEHVTRGHPDKICDQLSDAVLDACLAQDPMSRVACEACITPNGLVVLFGEITTAAPFVDYHGIVRGVLRDIFEDELEEDGGSDATNIGSGRSGGCGGRSASRRDVEAKSSPPAWWHTPNVLVAIEQQSPDIQQCLSNSAGPAPATTTDNASDDIITQDNNNHPSTLPAAAPPTALLGAGDQGMMFGYATDETESLMPLTHSLAMALTNAYESARRNQHHPQPQPQTQPQPTTDENHHLCAAAASAALSAVSSPFPMTLLPSAKAQVTVAYQRTSNHPRESHHDRDHTAPVSATNGIESSAAAAASPHAVMPLYVDSIAITMTTRGLFGQVVNDTVHGIQQAAPPSSLPAELPRAPRRFDPSSSASYSSAHTAPGRRRLRLQLATAAEKTATATGSLHRQPATTAVAAAAVKIPAATVVITGDCDVSRTPPPPTCLRNGLRFGGQNDDNGSDGGDSGGGAASVVEAVVAAVWTQVVLPAIPSRWLTPTSTTVSLQAQQLPRLFLHIDDLSSGAVSGTHTDLSAAAPVVRRQGGGRVTVTGWGWVGGRSGVCGGGSNGGSSGGLTGRKIIADSYGGWGSHGGGAFSGKDPTKVDRSAAYAARWIAKSLVAGGYAKRVLVQIAYAIGVADPLSVHVESFGTSSCGPQQKLQQRQQDENNIKEKKDDDHQQSLQNGSCLDNNHGGGNGSCSGAVDDADALLLDIVARNFCLRPQAIIDALQLRRPIYYATAQHGHFGGGSCGNSADYQNRNFSWEIPKKLI